MSKLKQTFATVTIVSVLIWGALPGGVSAVTAAELQAQIDALMAQLSTLQAQLPASTPSASGAPAACAGITFTRSLTVGSSGTDVKCLQALLNQSADTQVAASGVGSAGSETLYFGNLTRAAVVKYQEKYAAEILTPLGLAAGTGFFGPSSRARANTLLAAAPATTPTTTPTSGLPEGCTSTAGYSPTTGVKCDTVSTTTPTTPTTPVTPVVGTGLSVSVASDTPAAAVLPDGSAYNVLTKLNLSAGTDGAVNVTGFRITRTGISLNSDFSGVMVFDAAGKRHGNVLTLSENTALIMFTADPIAVPAGQTVAVTIQVNINAAQASNGTFAFGIAGAADVFTSSSATVSGSFPVRGNLFQMVDGSTTLGALDVDAVTISASARNVDLGSTNYIVGKFRLYEGASKEDITVQSIRFYNNGNTTDADLANVTLKNDTTGDVLSTSGVLVGKYITFNNVNLTILKGQNKTVSVSTDVVNGSTRTAQFIIQNDYDITAVGVSTASGVLATHATNLSGDASAGFPVGEATNYNTITVTQGSLTVTKHTSSPSGNISQGQSDVVLGYWQLEAIGEDIEIQKADFSVIGTSVIGDFSGTIRLVVGGSTVYSASIAAVHLDEDAAGADQVSLNTYYTIPSGTTQLLKVLVNTASAATNANTLIGNFGDVYYKRAASNNFATASDDAFVAANTLTINSAALTVAKNAAFGDQNVVAGGANTKIGSYVLQTSSAEGVNVSAINVDMSAITGMTNMKLKKVNTNGTETQIGSTVSTPSATDDANSFSVGGQLNIAASASVVVNVYVDMASTAVTVNTDIDAADVTSNGLSSGTALSGNVPTAQVVGQTITLQASGLLLVETDSSTPVEAVLHSMETDRELLRVKFTSTYEAIRITNLVVGSRRGNANLSAVSLTAGAVTVSTVPINGIATFSGLTLEVPKDSVLVAQVKGSTTSSGTLVSAEDVRLSVNSLEAIGLSSGSRVYERTLTTTGSAGDITVDAEVAVTVASTAGFALGDVVQIHNALTTSPSVSSFTGVVTVVTSATVLGVTGPQNLDSCATAPTTCYVTKFATREAMTAKVMGTPPTLLHTDGADTIDVSSTRGLAVGDVLRIEATSGSTDDGGFYTVTAVTDGDTINVIGVTEGDTSIVAYGTSVADRITRMATSSSTQVRALSTLTANTASALEVDSTIGFAVGDIIVVNSTVAPAATRPLYVVAAVTDSDTLSVSGKGTQTDVPIDSWVTELATTRTTTVSTASVITADTASAVTLTSTAGFAVGDIVYIQDDATAGGDVYMVSAVSSTTITVIGETGFTASIGAFVTILASSTGNGKAYSVQDVEPVTTLSTTSPSGTVSGSSNQIVAIFDIQAAGDVNLTVSALTLTRGGNIATRVAVGAQPKVYDYTSNTLGQLLGTGANWSGTAAGSTSAITLSPYAITAGQTLKIAVTVDTSAAAANDTFQVYIDNTGGLAGLFGGLSWYYTAISPSPGTEPTSSSVSTLSDTYPVYGNTLKY